MVNADDNQMSFTPKLAYPFLPAMMWSCRIARGVIVHRKGCRAHGQHFPAALTNRGRGMVGATRFSDIAELR